MQQKTPSVGTFIALALILIVAISLYFYYKGTPTDSLISSLETGTSPESVEAQAQGARILLLLNQIKALKIDDSIFKSAVYKSLVDYTVTIPEQNVGRANPFAPTSGFVPAKTSR